MNNPTFGTYLDSPRVHFQDYLLYIARQGGISPRLVSVRSLQFSCHLGFRGAGAPSAAQLLPGTEAPK
jgi:hypothetical protein